MFGWGQAIVISNELLRFIRSHRYAVEATVSEGATPQAAVIGFAITDRFEIVFETSIHSRKGQNLLTNPAISLVIGGLVHGDERTVQVDGVRDQPQGSELERLVAAYRAVFPEGALRAAWPGRTYFRVRPRWIRYSDFNRSPPEITELTAEALSAG